MLFCSVMEQVHIDYLEAGADIIITASYQVMPVTNNGSLNLYFFVKLKVLVAMQATIQGFEAKGFSTEESEALLRKSVEIAREARDVYYDRCTQCSSADSASGRILKRRPILVAASVGSYGAYLADGSEYR